jgi:hypothetical protein
MFWTHCRGFLGGLRGHCYEPRYSTAEQERAAPLGNVELPYGSTAEDLRRLLTLTSRTYCGDVCTRCGSTVEAPPSPRTD